MGEEGLVVCIYDVSSVACFLVGMDASLKLLGNRMKCPAACFPQLLTIRY